MRVFLAAAALDHVAVFQAHLVARKKAKEPFGRRLGEVIALDPHLGPKAITAQAEFGPLRVRGRLAGLQMLGVAAEGFHPVGELELDWLQHGHGARRLAFEVVAQRGVEQAVVDPAVLLGHPDALAKQLDARGGVAASTQAGEGRHARIVPAVDMALVDQLLELALAGDHVGEVQARELVLVRARLREQAEAA